MASQKKSEPEDRTKTSVVVHEPPPAFLSALVNDDHSLDNMMQYRVVPRLRVVQGLTKPEIKAITPEGGVLLMPSREVICNPQGFFTFNPIFFWTEFVKWRDRNDKSGFGIVERTTDENSELAKRARDQEQRVEEYPNPTSPSKKFQYKYVETMCFAGLVKPSSEGESWRPCVITFSRGEFRTGKNFINMCISRRVGGKPPPLWTQLWEFTVAVRTKDDYTWFGVEPRTPENGSPWIDSADVEPIQKLYEEYRDLFKRDLVRVDATDIDATDIDAPNPADDKDM